MIIKTGMKVAFRNQDSKRFEFGKVYIVEKVSNGYAIINGFAVCLDRLKHVADLPTGFVDELGNYQNSLLESLW